MGNSLGTNCSKFTTKNITCHSDRRAVDDRQYWSRNLIMKFLGCMWPPSFFFVWCMWPPYFFWQLGEHAKNWKDKEFFVWKAFLHQLNAPSHACYSFSWWQTFVHTTHSQQQLSQCVGPSDADWDHSFSEFIPTSWTWNTLWMYISLVVVHGSICWKCFPALWAFNISVLMFI